jgi:branched-chain amino acid transport system substrate-binding protein
MGQIVRALREAGVATQVLAYSDFVDEEAFEQAGKAVDGVVFALPVYDPKQLGGDAADFADRFTRRFGEAPKLQEACSYDAAALLATAISNGHRDAPAIAKYLSRLRNHNGVSGPITFDSHGMVHGKYSFITARKPRPTA